MRQDRRTALDPAGAASLPGPADTLGPPPPPSAGRPGRTERPGVVVVLFAAAPASEEHQSCDLARCPMGSARWFPDREAAGPYLDSLPAAFSPHILIVERDDR